MLCKNAPESRDHLYFDCPFSSQIWEYLVKGILCHDYTTNWIDIVRLISDSSMERKKLFCVRYAFQAAVHTLWRERNKIKHDDKLMPLTALKKMIDKGVRNKLSLVSAKGKRDMGEVLQFWFSTRM